MPGGALTTGNPIYQRLMLELNNKKFAASIFKFERDFRIFKKFGKFRGNSRNEISLYQKHMVLVLVFHFMQSSLFRNGKRKSTKSADLGHLGKETGKCFLLSSSFKYPRF